MIIGHKRIRVIPYISASQHRMSDCDCTRNGERRACPRPKPYRIMWKLCTVWDYLTQDAYSHLFIRSRDRLYATEIQEYKDGRWEVIG